MTDHTAAQAASGREAAMPLFVAGLLAVVAITAFRIGGLVLAESDLFFDEAQYWFWSRSIEGGYFSKPPGIALVIAATTSFCGDGEACVRMGAPLLYGVSAILCGLFAYRLAGPFAGFLAALFMATIPGITFGARLVSTDAPLMACWIAALLVYHRYLRTGFWRDALLLGALVGLGFLAKYAMVFFGFCLAIHALVERQVLRRLLDVKLWVGLGVAVAVFSPNIVWNLSNGAVTFSHTADNASWGGDLFNLDELAEFSGAQVGIIGPVLFAVILLGFWRHGRSLSSDERFLLAFSLPILATMCLQALISRANANWAALAFPALVLLAVLFLVRWRAESKRVVGWFVGIALLSHGIGLVGLAIVDVNMRTWSLQAERTPFKRVLGWEAVSNEIRTVAEERDIRTVVSNTRSVLAQLTYYLRDEPFPVTAWQYADSPRNHYEQVAPATPDSLGPVLLVTRCNIDFAADLPESRETGMVSVPIAAERQRRLYWAVIDAVPSRLIPLADCRG
ncbi:MAG: glycosyltransferase family 39 protein [Pseudomonadota bacterium]